MQTRFALLAVALLSAAAPAQTPEQGASGDVPFQPAQPALIDFEFRGGSLTELAALIRAEAAAAGRPVNIVLPSTADDGELPPIGLAGATVEDALLAVRMVVAPNVQLQVQSYRSEPAATAVFSVSIELQNQQPSRQRSPMLEVFSLAGLAPLPFDPAGEVGVTAETALSAVEAALSLTDEQGTTASIRYHVDSKLLFVRASAEDIVVVRKVVEQLQTDVTQLRFLARSRQNQARPADSAEGVDKQGSAPEQPNR